MPSGNNIYTHTNGSSKTKTEEMKWPNNVENISHTFYVLITMIVITASYSTERERAAYTRWKFRNKGITHGTKKVKVYEKAV